MKDLLLVESARPLLHTKHFGHRIEGYPALGSTNTRAAAWAAEGAEEGSVVVAEEQTSGRGRHGRTWTTAPGRNLTFSVVLRPSLTPEHLGLITLAACSAVCDAVEAFSAPVTPVVKWPNDVLLDGRKCCGMLLESTFGGADGRPEAVILGVGLNVNQDSFPADLAPSPTSLLLATGRPVPRAALFARLLSALERRYVSCFEDGGRAVRRAYEGRLRGLGKPLTLRQMTTGYPVQGIFRGVTSAGALRLETATGARVFHAGDVTTQ